MNTKLFKILFRKRNNVNYLKAIERIKYVNDMLQHTNQYNLIYITEFHL